MNVSEALNATADYIEANGWWSQTAAGCSTGTPACAANAMTRVTVPDVRLMVAVQDALIRHIGGADLPDIWAWNDAPDRTAAEVVEALRACAVIEAARETEGRLIHGPVIEPVRETVA